MLLCLALFVVFGTGCTEQKKKSKETGEAISDAVKNAEKNINGAVLKMQDKADQLEKVDK